ncbi:LFG2 protein, partial [Erythrocercus mccallii]|nr:LFG2 protein [Erythrocercus mccallii]
QLSVNSKPPSSEGDKKDNATAPPAPPSYEEATAGEGMKSGAFPAPPAAPLHPSWAYVDPSKKITQKSCGNPAGGTLVTQEGTSAREAKRAQNDHGIMEWDRIFPAQDLFLLSCSEPVKGYIQTHSAWYWASYAVFFVTYLILACCSGPRYWGFMLSLPSPCLSASPLPTPVAMIQTCFSWEFCSYYNTKSVLLCLGITALVCLSVTIFSFQSK